MGSVLYIFITNSLHTKLTFNPGPAEPEYALSLQTV